MTSQPNFNDLQLGNNRDDGYKTGHRNGFYNAADFTRLTAHEDFSS
jgi:hypothetical protein